MGLEDLGGTGPRLEKLASASRGGATMPMLSTAMTLGYPPRNVIALPSGLAAKGPDPAKVEPLIPFVRKSGFVDYRPEAMFRKVKGKLEIASGVRFHLKTLMATFAQLCKDNGASIEAVSKGLRHGSSKTTEKYYARTRHEAAFRELETAWNRQSIPG